MVTNASAVHRTPVIPNKIKPTVLVRAIISSDSTSRVDLHASQSPNAIMFGQKTSDDGPDEAVYGT